MNPQTAASLPEISHLILIGEILVFTMKVVAMVLGFLTIRIGSTLLEKGVKGEFKFGGEAAGGKATLTSASPGLLFVLLGAIIIGYSMFASKGWSLDAKEASRIAAQQTNMLEGLLPSKSEIHNGGTHAH